MQEEIEIVVIEKKFGNCILFYCFLVGDIVFVGVVEFWEQRKNTEEEEEEENKRWRRLL